MKKIDSNFAGHILKIIKSKYPFIKSILSINDKMTINEYMDVIVVVDCDDFCKFYGIKKEDEPFDTGFLNKTTHNFHFVLDTIFTINNRKLQDRVEKDGVDIKQKVGDLVEMLLMNDEDFREKFKPHEINLSSVQFYMDCDNKY